MNKKKNALNINLFRNIHLTFSTILTYQWTDEQLLTKSNCPHEGAVIYEATLYKATLYEDKMVSMCTGMKHFILPPMLAQFSTPTISGWLHVVIQSSR
jgi:hypothetical protein